MLNCYLSRERGGLNYEEHRKKEKKKKRNEEEKRGGKGVCS